MKWREVAEQINAMSPERQEESALIFDDNVGRFIELTSFFVEDEEDEEEPKTYLKEANKYFDES